MPSNPYPHHPNLAGLLGLDISHKSGHIFRCSNLFQHLDDLKIGTGNHLCFLWIVGWKRLRILTIIPTCCVVYLANDNKILNLTYIRSFWGVRIPLRFHHHGFGMNNRPVGHRVSTLHRQWGVWYSSLPSRYVAWLVAPTKCYKPRESKDQTLPIGSRESFIWTILKTILCLVLDFQSMCFSFRNGIVDEHILPTVTILHRQNVF